MPSDPKRSSARCPDTRAQQRRRHNPLAHWSLIKLPGLTAQRFRMLIRCLFADRLPLEFPGTARYANVNVKEPQSRPKVSHRVRFPSLDKDAFVIQRQANEDASHRPEKRTKCFFSRSIADLRRCDRFPFRQSQFRTRTKRQKRLADVSFVSDFPVRRDWSGFFMPHVAPIGPHSMNTFCVCCDFIKSCLLFSCSHDSARVKKTKGDDLVTSFRLVDCLEIDSVVFRQIFVGPR